MALEFAKQGCNLALSARRIEKLQSLQDEILAIRPEVQIFIRTLDVTDHEEVFAVFRAFQKDFNDLGQEVDRVIVNAGMGKGASLGKGDEPRRFSQRRRRKVPMGRRW